MPRPPRIEYENAFYHVMNRGRGRQMIFHGDEYYSAFLDTLAEAHQRFKCVIHAYCLMGNHYHILLETPNANLSRVMRHINGVYTQRYNRMKCTDGSLFRGRYKAVLVSQDEYLLQLSRYIHRNPIETTIPMVERLEDYPWSSYPAYIGKKKPEDWLERQLTYQLLKRPEPYVHYCDFVMQGVDEATQKFHEKGNMGAIFADDVFKQWVYEALLPGLEAEGKSRVVQPDLSISVVTTAVASHYYTTTQVIRKSTRGPQQENEPRKVAMYLCQALSAAKLWEIADYFNLHHIGSVSFSTHQVRKKKRENNAFAANIEYLIKNVIKADI
jgi:putative transposase